MINTVSSVRSASDWVVFWVTFAVPTGSSVAAPAVEATDRVFWVH